MTKGEELTFSGCNCTVTVNREGGHHAETCPAYTPGPARLLINTTPPVLDISFLQTDTLKTVLTIKPDGTVERGPGFTTEDEASLTLWAVFERSGNLLLNKERAKVAALTASVLAAEEMAVCLEAFDLDCSCICPTHEEEARCGECYGCRGTATLKNFRAALNAVKQ